MPSLQVSDSNNEVEFKALINGLRLAKSMGVRHLNVISDS